MDDFSCQCEIDGDNDSRQSSDSSKKNVKSLHTLCQSMSISQSEDNADYYFRRFKETEETIGHKNLIIKMLQEQLQKLEGCYRNTLDETQSIRYKYSYTAQELNNLKNIFKKYEEENKKLRDKISKLGEKHETEGNEKEMQELQNEAEKWKQQYEELLKKIANMEDDTAKMRELLNVKDMNVTKAPRATDGDDLAETLLQNSEAINDQYGDIKAILKILNEKLERILDRVKSGDDRKYLIDTVQGEMIEISIEAKKLPRFSDGLQEMSEDKHRISTRGEAEKMTQLVDCNLVLDSNTAKQLEMYKNQLALLKDENEALNRRLQDCHQNCDHRNSSLVSTTDSIDHYKTNPKRSILTKVEDNDYDDVGRKRKVSIQCAPSLYSDDSISDQNEVFQQSYDPLQLNSDDRVSKLEKDLEVKMNTISSLMEENSTIIATVSNLREQIDKMRKNHDEVADKYNESCLDLSEKLSVIKKLDATVQNLQDENSQLKSQVDQLLSENYERLENNAEEVEVLEREIAAQAELIEEYQSEKKKHENRIEELEKELKDLTLAQQELLKQVDTLKLKEEQYFEELNLKEHECNHLRKQSRDLEQAVETITEEKIVIEKQLNKNKNALADVASEFNRLKSDAEGSEELAKAEMAKLSNENAKLSDNVALLNEINYDLTNKLKQCKCAEYEDKLRCVEEKCRMLKVKNEELLVEASDKVEVEQLLQFAEEKLVGAEKEIEDIHEKLMEKVDDFETLEKQWNEFKNEQTVAADSIEKLRVENRYLKTMLKRLVDSLESKINKYQKGVKQTSADLTTESSSAQFAPREPKTDPEMPPRNLDAEELILKRRYMLNRINSIDDKLDGLMVDATKFQDVLANTTKNCEGQTKKATCKTHAKKHKVLCSAYRKHKVAKDPCSSESATKNICSQKHSQLSWKMYSNCFCQDKMRWQKSFKVVKTMRKEMDQVNKHLLRKDKGNGRSPFGYDSCNNCLRGSNFEGVIYLKKPKSRLQSSGTVKTTSNYDSSSSCYFSANPAERQQILLAQLNSIEKAIKENAAEEQKLVSQYEKIIKQKQRRQNKNEPVTSAVPQSSSSSALSIPPQPFIKIECDTKCSGLPNTLFINTYCESVGKKSGEKRGFTTDHEDSEKQVRNFLY